MASPFITYGGSSSSSSSGSVKVNYIGPDPLGNIKVGLGDISDVDIVEESLASGEFLQYDTTKQKWSNILVNLVNPPWNNFSY